MRATVPMNLDAKLTPAEASKAKRDFMIQLLNSKADWLELHLKKILPTDIYSMAHDTSGTEDEFLGRQEYVRKAMRRMDIRLEEHGLNARLFRGKELISQFFVKLAEE